MVSAKVQPVDDTLDDDDDEEEEALFAENCCCRFFIRVSHPPRLCVDVDIRGVIAIAIYVPCLPFSERRRAYVDLDRFRRRLCGPHALLLLRLLLLLLYLPSSRKRPQARPPRAGRASASSGRRASSPTPTSTGCSQSGIRKTLRPECGACRSMSSAWSAGSSSARPRYGARRSDGRPRLVAPPNRKANNSKANLAATA